MSKAKFSATTALKSLCIRRKPTANIEKSNVNYDYHKLSIAQLLERFETSISQGLSKEKAKSLLIRNGKNELKKPSTHILRKLFKYCFSGFCWLLWIGSIILFIAWRPLGDPDPDPNNLGLAILLILVIALQAVFEAFQDWSSGQVMKSIKNMMPSEAIVIRDGSECHIAVSDLVVGDVVVLTNGSKVPADLRLIESHDLKFDRSMITG
jgi:sodium/potassium-transporting ATPase subunit alpha